jgi:hypothetical protein
MTAHAQSGGRWIAIAATVIAIGTAHHTTPAAR